MISPGLYNIYSEHIMRCVLEERDDGITIGGKRETNFAVCRGQNLAELKQERVGGPAQKGKISQYIPKHIA